MKTAELRIDNWVQFRHTETPVKITLGDFAREYKNERHLEDYEPIPLTEEWLKRFGFRLPAHTWIGDKFHLSEYGKGSKYPNGKVWVVAMSKNNAIIAEIKHAHQLQNLYHALTGEELNQNKEDE
tara:strand:+ start:4120 stop:4494 length:375 start_codon:yes stop_codon:yes gene_type:complete